jgi:hypothetical protein
LFYICTWFTLQFSLNVIEANIDLKAYSFLYLVVYLMLISFIFFPLLFVCVIICDHEIVTLNYVYLNEKLFVKETLIKLGYFS